MPVGNTKGERDHGDCTMGGRGITIDTAMGDRGVAMETAQWWRGVL